MKLSFEELQRRRREREEQSRLGRVPVDDARAELKREWRTGLGCPPEVEFAAYCEGTLSFLRRIAVARHVRRCPFCQEAWATIRSLEESEPVTVGTETVRSRQKRVRRLGWAVASGAALLVLAQFWPMQNRVSTALVRFALQDVREVRVRSRGPRALVVCDLRGIGRDGRLLKEHEEFPVQPDGTVNLEMRSRPGVYTARLEVAGGEFEGAGKGAFVGAGGLRPGDNRFILDRDEKNYFRKQNHDVLRQLLSNPRHVKQLAELPADQLELLLARIVRDDPELRFSAPSINLYDDVRVYSSSHTFLDESFEAWDPGFLPPGLATIWGGRLMQIIDLETSPSGRQCLLNSARPNWNAHSGIPLTPSDIKSNEVTFEVSFYLTDPRKGVSFGLKRVLGHGEAEDNAGMIEADEGSIQLLTYEHDPHNPPGPDCRPLAKIEAERWYRVKATVSLQHHWVDLWLDGIKIGERLPLKTNPRNPNFDFSHFSFGGVNFSSKK